MAALRSPFFPLTSPKPKDLPFPTSSCCCFSSSTLSSSTSATAVPPPIVVAGDPPTFVSAPGRRIIAVGDLHGDLSKARCALQMAGVLSSDDQNTWTGKHTVLIQLGDILDRGEDEIAILSLLRSLQIQAKSHGGAVFQINGNHETMNVEGDFRYVDSGGFDECSDFLSFVELSDHNWDGAFLNWINISTKYKQSRKSSQNPWRSLNLVEKQKGVVARSLLFKQGGFLANELSKNGVILKVNDWIFCHGGVLPHHVAYGLDRMNREVSEWMRGMGDGAAIPFIATRGYDSVVWSRLYSRDVSGLEDYQIQKIGCVLQESLEDMGAKGMVVGHTPQLSGANCKYNCRIWRIDVGMSRGVLNARPEVLEICNDRTRVIRSEN